MGLGPPLDNLPERYTGLLERALAVLSNDGRVKALWVSGSWARGDADSGSDLDLVMATTDDGYVSLVESARVWWEKITSTVLLETVPHVPNVWYSVAPDGARLDIVIEQESDLESTPHLHRLAVHDPDGLSAQVPAPSVATGADPDGVEWRLKELFRAVCLVEVVTIRQDWLLGVQGCALMQRTLADLYAAANGTASANGVKHYASRLTPEQRALLESLPPIAATRQEVIAGNRAIFDAVVSTVPPLATTLGVTWPSGLECTARALLERTEHGR